MKEQRVNQINAGWQLGCAFFAWANAVALHQAGAVVGVVPAATVFFTLFGVWNLVYYRSKGDRLSLLAGLVTVAGNAAWVIQAALFQV